MDKKQDILTQVLHDEEIMQYRALLGEKEKKEEEGKKAKYELWITEEEKKSGVLVGKKEKEEEKLH